MCSGRAGGGLAWAVVLLLAAAARGQEFAPPDAARLRVLVPANGAELVAKRPEIRIEFAAAPEPGSFLILLDGSDITPIVRTAGNVVSARAPLDLPPGAHRFEVVAGERERRAVRHTVSFTTRHSVSFAEATSVSRAAGAWERIVRRPEGGEALPTDAFEATLSTAHRLKDPGLEFALEMDLQYRDQDLTGAADPLAGYDPLIEKGLFLPRYLLRGAFEAGGVRTQAEVGTIEIDETEFTASVRERRGGRLAIDQKHFAASVFSVDSRNLTRFEDGIGIGGGQENRVLGGTASLKFPSRLELKGIYLTGGTAEDSLGIASTDIATGGNLFGALLTTDFFHGAFRTEFEFASSEYDPDTVDDQGAKRDRAWKVGADGAVSRYTWQAAYEYLGPDYASVGNPYLPRDRAGYRLGVGATVGSGTIALDMSQHRDNVDDNVLFPRITDTAASANWYYSGFAAIPLSLGYQRFEQVSSREPEGVLPLDQATDTFTGSVAYTSGSLNVGFLASLTAADDRSEFNNDVVVTTYSLTPSWGGTALTLAPSAAFTRSTSKRTDVTTSTSLYGLTLRTALWKEVVTFEASGSYGVNTADDNSLDNRESRADLRLAVAAKRLFNGAFEPAVALRARYTDTRDKIDPTAGRDDLEVYLVVTAAVPLSF